MMSDIFTLKKEKELQQSEIDELKNTVEILTQQNEVLKNKNIKMGKDIQEIRQMVNDLKK